MKQIFAVILLVGLCSLALQTQATTASSSLRSGATPSYTGLDDPNLPDYETVENNVKSYYNPRMYSFITVMVEPVGNWNGGYIYDIYVRIIDSRNAQTIFNQFKARSDYDGFIVDSKLVSSKTQKH